MIRKIHLLLSVIFVAPLAFAQRPNLDSLWNVWQDESQADTTRLKAIHGYAWAGYIHSMPDSAFHYAQMEYDFAKASGLEAYMAEALNTQGVSLRKRGEYSKAMRYHKEGLAIFERTGKQGSVASVSSPKIRCVG